MIIEASKNETTIVSNISVGEVIPMTISEAGMAYAMSNLSNMYNDPKLAVIREYFTNALDSHVKSGQTEPVLVSLPDNYNKMYVVQDFGTGMSMDTIRDVYSKYWESTKRDSNNQIGAFGLGAKSGLAIANQFTLASVHEGVKVTLIIQKAGDGSGIPKQIVASVIETDEPNGVTVSIPVEDPYYFNQKAHEFFRFVDPGVVLVNGSAPSSIFTNATKLELDLEDDFGGVESYIDLSRSYGTSYVVMGQVAYALTTDNLSEIANRLDLSTTYELRSMPVYFKVPIGAVNLTPNREGLLFDDKTNGVLDALIKAYFQSVKQTAQDEIDAIDSRFKVYDLAKEWEDRLGTKLQWRGEDIITSVSTANPTSTIKRSSWEKTSHGSTWTINLRGDRNSKILVTGVAFDKYRRISNYITDYLEMDSIRGAITFYFREALDELDTEWVTENPNFIFEDFEDMIQRVKDFRKARRAAARAALPKEQRDRPAKMEYAVLDLDDGLISQTAYDSIPSGAYYLHASEVGAGNHKGAFEGKRFGGRDLLERLRTLLGDGASVVFIPKTRSLEAFLARAKDVEDLKSLKDIATDVQARIDDLMTPEVVAQRDRYLGYSANRRLANMTPARIEQILDEEVRTLVAPVPDEIKEANENANTLFRAFNALQLLGEEVTVPSRDRSVEELDSADRYPLLDAISHSFLSETQQDHLVQYINSVYTSQLTLVDA